MASGLPWRAPIIRSCSPAKISTMANAPSSWRSVAATASFGEKPSSR
jgi:hypothetical protein